MGMGSISLAPLQTKIKVSIDSFKSDMDKASSIGVSKAKEMSKKMQGALDVSKKLSSLGSTLTKSITLPVAGAMTAFAKLALSAESSFSKVLTIADRSKLSVEDLKKGVVDASNESGVAIEDFNEALYQSISAGVDSGKAIEFTTQMTKLAKGGFTSTESAVNVVTTALNAYGLQAEEATAVSDKLITTQNLGKTSVNELASSMGRVIPSANSYKVNLDNVCASLADLTKNGIATAEATTYYNSMLNELGKSGTAASKVIKSKLGASFTELMAKGVPVTDVLKTLKDEATKSGKSLGDMFGSAEAAKAALTIMKDDGVEYNQILEQMKGSAGATQKAFDEMDASPLEQLKKTMNSLKNTGIELGQALIPMIMKVNDAVKIITEKLKEMTPVQQELILKIGFFVAALGPLFSIIGKVIFVFTQLIPAISGASAALTSVTSLLPSLGGALTALTGPVGIVIGIVGALAIAVATNFDNIRGKISETMENIKNLVQAVWEAIKTLWDSDFNSIKEITSDVMEIIKTVIDTAFNVINDILKIFTDIFKGDWSNLWEDIKNLFSDLWDGICDALGNFLNLCVDILLGMVVDFLNGGYELITGLWEGMKNVWNDLTFWFEGFLDDPIQTISDGVADFFRGGDNLIGALWEGLKSKWSSLCDWFNSKIEWLKSKLTFWNDAKGQMSGGEDGSHYNGLSYVPKDGYRAILHKGERVLTKEENKAYSRGITGNTGPQTFIIENTLNMDGQVVATSTNRILGQNYYLSSRGLA